MGKFRILPEIHNYDSFADFKKEFRIGRNDLIVTSRKLAAEYMKNAGDCVFMFTEDLNLNEPLTDAVIDNASRIMSRCRVRIRRITGIGGGTVLDICKILRLRMPYESKDLFLKNTDTVKEQKLILIPGEFTGGREITGQAEALVSCIGKTQTISSDTLSPDAVILIPELFMDYDVKTLALETASELEYCRKVSIAREATPFDRMLAGRAAGIISGVCGLSEKTGCPQADRFKLKEEIMQASLYTGIVYENTRKNKQSYI